MGLSTSQIEELLKAQTRILELQKHEAIIDNSAADAKSRGILVDSNSPFPLIRANEIEQLKSMGYASNGASSENTDPDIFNHPANGDGLSAVQSKAVMEKQKDGSLVLRPAVTVPVETAWFFKNQKAQNLVRAGLEESAQGKLKKVNWKADSKLVAQLEDNEE